MDREEDRKKITAIVPTFNEAARIGRVLDTLCTYSGFADIIVVDDGSADDTEEIIQSYPVQYIQHTSNKGKGYAMDIGVSLAKTDIVFFVDADVSGLTHQMIDDITRPVVDGDVDMFIGMRNRKIYYLHSIIAFVPLLGGERTVRKSLWKKLPPYYKHRFRVEAGLNFYAKYYGKGLQYKIIKGLSQVAKEKKYGFVQGMKQRIGMMANIITAQFKLQFVEVPESERNRRILAFIAFQGLLGMLVGGLFLAAAYFGPTTFLNALFAEEQREDPSTPIIHYLLYLSNITAVSTLIAIGLFLCTTNLLTFLLTFKKLLQVIRGISNKIKLRRP